MKGTSLCGSVLTVSARQETGGDFPVHPDSWRWRGSGWETRGPPGRQAPPSPARCGPFGPFGELRSGRAGLAGAAGFSCALHVPAGGGAARSVRPGLSGPCAGAPEAGPPRSVRPAFPGRAPGRGRRSRGPRPQPCANEPPPARAGDAPESRRPVRFGHTSTRRPGVNFRPN